MKKTSIAIAATLGLMLPGAEAEVVTATPSYMELSQVHQSDLSPAELWNRLTIPAEWWKDAHTYSGSADNLTLELTAGGLWREDWDGGSVAHGRVLMVQEGEGLRLEAPFGPLQGLGVSTALTLTITPQADGGSLLNMIFMATGAENSSLETLAGPVDGVWDEALSNLASPARQSSPVAE